MSYQNRLLWAAALAALAGLVLLPLATEAGTLVTERAAAPDERAERSAAAPATRFQVRCWQYGRLLFEEQDVTLTDELVGGLKLRGTDRHRHPLMVTDTGNATCLIRANPPTRR
jgi:hypothetical protein